MIWWISLLFMAAVPVQDRPSGQPIGMILQVQGQAQIQRRSALQTTARVADFLYAGDHVSTGFGRATLLSCPSPETVTLKEDTEVELNTDALKTLRGQILSRVKVETCPMLRVALGSETLERVGGLRARGFPPIAIYLGGPVSSSRPVFEWATLTAAQTFHLVVRDSKNSVVWEHRENTSRVTYPSPLPPGDYQWELRAESDGKTIATQSANFEVKPSSLAAPDAQTPSLLRAAALEQSGYYSEAAAEFRALRASDPGDIRITRHLAWLYWNAGLLTASNEETQKLRN